ncbi:MAG: hypothetical protein OXF02_01095 [Simkaniaceae bacterium]|nr:hypothetical protein [Simkaniaceae bacterium]
MRRTGWLVYGGIATTFALFARLSDEGARSDSCPRKGESPSGEEGGDGIGKEDRRSRKRRFREYSVKCIYGIVTVATIATLRR